MTRKATFRFPLLLGFKQGVQAQQFHRLGDFLLSAKLSSYGVYGNDIDITCEPKNAHNRTILWNCLAKVTLSTVPLPCYDDLVTELKLFRNNDRNLRFSTLTNFLSCNVHIEIVESIYADLSEPNNPLIDGLEDATHFKADGVEMYLSKKVLGFHSHFFHNMFNGNFEEETKDFYELKDINADDFLRFLGIIHAIDLSVDVDSVESLLYLGNVFHCKLVLRLCEDYLLNLTEEETDSEKKLDITRRYKLNRVLLGKMALKRE
ncbi:hypothetical protein L596_013017 [Steinernema carpocapsae]|uniref:BTB domain-containing protein n=1 Tax=Steinernema carpocapsae TaxID=34508 RepID=A0A4V6A520_STECR|nr:hypothetical protein L596_013017 [Steinernema carpocapsae]